MKTPIVDLSLGATRIKNSRHEMPGISDGKENGYFFKGSLDPALKRGDCASPPVQKDLNAAKSMLKLLSQHLPTDYLKIDSTLQKKEWGKLEEANHRLLGALLYCGAPQLEAASVALRVALQSNNDSQIIQSAKILLLEMKNLIAHKC